MPVVPRLKDYEFIRLLGGGAFGEVWLVRYIPLEQSRAMKLLPSEQWSEEESARMIEEAKKMASLPKHPNRVQVYSVYAGLTNCYLAMEYFDGGALSNHTSATSPMPWEKATRYVADVANGLQEVHALGILHRDIKPDNILLDTHRDEAALADFGIAASAATAKGMAGARSFCAPEVKAGGCATIKSDVYSLGATLFYLVAGYPPDRYEKVENSPDSERIPAAVMQLIQCCLEPDQQRRPDLKTLISNLRHVRHAELADRLLKSMPKQDRKTQLEINMAVAPWSSPERFRPLAIESLQQTALDVDNLMRIESLCNAPGYLHVLVLTSSGSLDVVVPSKNDTDNHILPGQRHTFILKLSPPGGTDYVILVWTRKNIRPEAASWRRWLEEAELRRKQKQKLTLEQNMRTVELVSHEREEPPRGEWIARVLPLRHADRN